MGSVSPKPTESVSPGVPAQKIRPATFDCPHCRRQFRRQSMLNIHLQNYHITKDITPQSSTEVSSTSKKKMEPNGTERYYSYYLLLLPLVVKSRR